MLYVNGYYGDMCSVTLKAIGIIGIRVCARWSQGVLDLSNACGQKHYMTQK
jgi:hypothetical protein